MITGMRIESKPMIPYQKEKIENAICYFASRHKEKTGKYLFQTSLYKYLSLFEFEFLKKYGQPPIGLTYRAMDWGPVPIEIYGKREKYDTPCFSFRKNPEGKITIVPKAKPDMDYFSMAEIDEMARLVEIYADEFVTSEDMSKASHSEISAWRKTYEKKPNEIIDFKLTFDDDIETKPPQKLSSAEENYLIYKGLKEAASK
jgi:hypothetical protein